jgi:hypothetical protein
MGMGELTAGDDVPDRNSDSDSELMLRLSSLASVTSSSSRHSYTMAR